MQKRICSLVIFLSEKKGRHGTGSFSFLFGIDYRHSLMFNKFERQWCFFGVARTLLTC